MLKLQRFIRVVYANAALVYLVVSLHTVQEACRMPLALAHETPRNDEWPAFAAMLLGNIAARGIYLMPLALGLLFGWTWWSLRAGRPAARKWAMAAAVVLTLSALPLILPVLMLPDGGLAFQAIIGGICTVSLATGLAGIIAFRKKANPSGSVQDVPAPRVHGDGTNKALDVIALALQIGGTLALIEMYSRWGTARDLPVPSGLAWQLDFLGIALAMIVLHEAGHALVGLAVGMQVRAFVAGPFQWRIESGRWKFRFRPTQILAFSGAAGLVAVDPDQNRWCEISMILAGPGMNLLTGGIAAGLAYIAVGRAWEPYWSELALFASLSIVTAIVNLIPFRPDSLYSDGARIYQIFRGGPMADYQRATKTVVCTLVSARRPRDYDIGAIRRAAAYFTEGFQAMLLRLWESSYLYDTGDMAGAGAAFAEAERICNATVKEMPVELYTALVTGALLLRRDAVAARGWWEKMQAARPTKLNADYRMAECALHWSEGNAEEARAAYAAGKALLAEMPRTGAYDYDREFYEKMETLLREPPATVDSRMTAQSDEGVRGPLVPSPAMD